jgi:ligand-binding sensor domain-containing protein
MKVRNLWYIIHQLILTIFFIALVFVSLPSFSQNISFSNLSVKKGLSQGNVWDVRQDKLGFIWIATEDGLNLFDGYNFTIFRNDMEDSSSISNNYIRCIAEDKNGDIWVGTQGGGVNRYDRKLNQFERFMNESVDKESLGNKSVSSIFVDSKNNLWVGTRLGLNRYDPKLKTFKLFIHDPNDKSSISSGIIRAITEDDLNQLWVGTMTGLCRLNADGKSFTNYYHSPEEPTSLSSNQITALHPGGDNALWVGTFDGGLNLMNIRKGTFTHYLHSQDDPSSLASPYVYDINSNKQGQLWVATDRGLNLLDKSKGTFLRYTHSPEDETSIRSNNVTNIFFDINDRMWISTRFGAVNVYDKGQGGIKHFKQSTIGRNSISGNNVTSFAEDEHGDIWIGVDGDGLNYYNRGSNTFTTLQHQPDNIKNSLSNNKVLAVRVDHSEGLWIGYWNGGLDYYDRKTKQFKHYKFDAENPRSLSNNNIFYIFEDSDGDIWIATHGNGLNKYNRDTDDFTRYIHDKNDPKTISPSPLTNIAEDHLGKLWISSEQEGVNVFDPETETFEHYKFSGQKGDISGNTVNVVYEDSEKRLWVGTTSGLNYFDRKSGTFRVYRKIDGLPNENIVGILEDNKQNLWISTNKGLSRFNPETQIFKNYDVIDGLQDNQFNRWAFTRLSSGELLFGGVNGFNLLTPDRILENSYMPPVYITDFKLFNKSVSIGDDEVLKENIVLTKEIVLDYTQNFISFEFVALNYLQPEKNKYKYILEGLQTEWIDSGFERRATYTNLSPGNYTFRVMASNNDGIWSDHTAEITIKIIPPFWKTWWFISSIIILSAYGIIFYIQYQRKKVKREQEKLNAVINERTRELVIQNEEIVKKSEQEKVYNWITKGLASISETISKNSNDLHALANETLKNIVKYVEAQQGLIALGIKDDPNDEHLKIIGTYGVSKKQYEDERIEVGCGLLGETYKDKEKKVLNDLPADYLKIESGLGKALPAKVILQPIQTEDGEIVGVIELAFLHDKPKMVEDFLDKVSGLIALNIVAVTLNHKTLLLLQQSKEQTEEMHAQEEEMRQNMEELEATQEEFRRREEEFTKRIEELENQVNEKRTTN